ncbi:polysaccharide deacetylase family protein [Marinilongibacter aquaticus]|uniref:polysaccharide deacetylase family protein n=1 Tax=Marinilongibacter aquaticus TaxID=2975157 RepID=UPI0021BDC38F|nr:polysaccharide deacetylase family protein [Marinilongibacter aquaticus]UBM58584.1 polysaccharide deacetylase family protein [Marinilongibacter aquaticus]
MLFRTPKLLQWYYPGLIWQKKAKKPTIYLTFDDGPIPDVTDFVLHTLAQFGARATFFCIGDNIRKHPEEFARILQAGHRVGNHTYNHLKGWETDDSAYLENITQCQKYLPENEQKTLLRPPYGRIKRSQIQALKEAYEIVMWTVLTQDYDQKLAAETCLSKSIAATKPNSIVVFHDSLKAEKNLRFVLPKFLAHFAEKGFHFESL